VFRFGDKVTQLRNNYDKGTAGVFNGTTGVVTGALTVRTDEDQESPYPARRRPAKHRAPFLHGSIIGGAMISGELPPCAVAHVSPLYDPACATAAECPGRKRRSVPAEAHQSLGGITAHRAVSEAAEARIRVKQRGRGGVLQAELALQPGDRPVMNQRHDRRLGGAQYDALYPGRVQTLRGQRR
jgi:hypothetical protein